MVKYLWIINYRLNLKNFRINMRGEIERKIKDIRKEVERIKDVIRVRRIFVFCNKFVWDGDVWLVG